MKISYNWLKSYVKDLPSPEKLVEVFTFHICEVEETEKLPNSDYVLDIKVLPDRAHDLLSHRGVARDIAGILDLKFNEIKFEASMEDPTKLEIKIETDKCRRYMGRIVRNVTVGLSPAWMKDYLETLGQRSINNLVDATNIVMFDTGNPIHIFDLDKLANKKIIVRDAEDGELMTTLDSKEIKFTTSNMVIADEKDILAIAGVKGGKKAEVDENTKNIVIEVANFDPTSVRKTAKAVNIYTDAVKRFENDLSPEIAESAMEETVALILEMCKDAKLEEVVDVYSIKQKKNTIKFGLEKISKILGLDVSTFQAEKILKQFGYSYKLNGDEFEMEVPFNRPDLAIPEDMAEEIGRAIGYDKIEAKLPEIILEAKADDTFSKIMFTHKKLLENGYSEIMNYAFCNKGEVEVLASASDKKFLRTNLTDGLKESIKLNNLNLPLLDVKEIKVFEIGTVFKKSGEEIHVAYGDKKNVTEMLLDQFVTEKLSPQEHGYFSTEKFLVLAPSRSQGSLEETFHTQTFKPWSIFPFISRDVAVWVPSEIESNQVYKVIKENAGKLLIKEPRLFDEFKKDGKTSYAFRLVFQSHERTLTDDEINKIMENITVKINKNPNWQIR